MSSHNITIQPWMQSLELQTVMEALGEGYARLVGGCVRDAVLEKPIKDIDIATPHAPEKVMELLEGKGVKTIPTGLKHGTVTAVINHQTFEITTLRRDVACDGRHAEVEFTDDWEEDAARRDFTFNALSMTVDGTVYDYFGGIEDLKKGVVRFVGEAEQRVQEDYLRILRYFRFKAHYGAQHMDKESLKACVKYVKDLKTLSGERIQAEMLKILSAVDPYYVLLVMLEEGILVQIIPDFEQGLSLEPLKALIEAEQEHEVPMPHHDPLCRLTLLLNGDEAQVEKLADSWKLSNSMREALLVLARNYKRIAPDSGSRMAKKLLRQLGKERFGRVVLVQWARDPKHAEHYAALLTIATEWEIPELPLGGDDIIALGIKEGAEVGEMLHRAEEYWEEHAYEPDRNQLVNYIKEQIDN